MVERPNRTGTEQNRTEHIHCTEPSTFTDRIHSHPHITSTAPTCSHTIMITQHVHSTLHDYTLMLPAFEWGGMLECTLVGSLSGSPLSGIEFGSRFPSLRDDHFPRFHRWRPTLTMFKYIYVYVYTLKSTPREEASPGKACLRQGKTEGCTESEAKTAFIGCRMVDPLRALQ